MTSPSPDVKRTDRSQVALAVEARVSALQEQYAHDSARAVRTLAVLRRAAGSVPGDDADTWEEVLALVGAHGRLGSADAPPSAHEWAAHLALTLFATHQQSKRDQKMHKYGQSLGHAARLLANQIDSEEASAAVIRRFKTLGTASTLAEVAHHARTLITQLRSNDIALDYGLLTDHLIKLQNPEKASAVRLAWGRDFYRTPHTSHTADKPDSPEDTDLGDPA